MLAQFDCWAVAVLASCIPCAEQIDSAGEEASLKDAQDSSQGGNVNVILDKAHAQCNGTPQKGDACEVGSWANGANKDRGGRLEDDICDEEDEVGNILL